jgi:hypothetical protein
MSDELARCIFIAFHAFWLRGRNWPRLQRS